MMICLWRGALLSGRKGAVQLENNEGSEKGQLLDQIKKLTLENERLKQEIAKLRGVKRPSSGSMDSMSTKLKEALRE
ncbi:hypothetical protein [Paenibacillus sp. Soil724D2]|uniref:hypothetical protein n=1 Tax=Paenibacillus sp. (strain Soil724D2) TaxID=1736392 RepID=UPI0012E383C0|nr:hypothetical protein [Paenibacillus sp. Soil724D2]